MCAAQPCSGGTRALGVQQRRARSMCFQVIAPEALRHPQTSPSFINEEIRTTREDLTLTVYVTTQSYGTINSNVEKTISECMLLTIMTSI